MSEATTLTDGFFKTLERDTNARLLELDSRVQKDREDGDDRMLNYHIGARDALCEFIRSFIYKYESPAITKTGNPMPEILPGYVVSYNNLEWTVTKKYSGGRFDIYRDRKRISVGHQDKITRVWDLDGILVWSKE